MYRYRFVFSWRWIRLHVLIWLVLIPAFIFLGIWQETRYHQQNAENDVLSAAMHGTPVPLTSLDTVGGSVDASRRFRQVTISGTYDTAHQYLVRNRQNNGNPGFYVVTPLDTVDGSAIMVNRGWIPTQDTDEQTSPPIPTPPSGVVHVVGRLQPSETKGSTGLRDITAGLPAGQITLMNTDALATATGRPLYGGYIELISSQPGDSPSLTLMSDPSLNNGPYLAYWFQWWLFCAMAVGAWVMIIRREAQHRDADAFDDEDDEEYEEYEDDDESEEEEDGPSEDADDDASDDRQVSEPAL